MEALKRAVRTALQLIAAGGLTALVNAIAGGLSPETAALVLAGWQVAVTFAHNALEDHTALPAILKTPPPPSG